MRYTQIFKREFGSLLSGKTVKRINYTEINKKRIYEREKIRIRNKRTIKDLYEVPNINIKGLMHYTNVIIDNNPPNSHIYKLLNPIAKLRLSKLGTKSLVGILLYYIQNDKENFLIINNIIKEIIRRFYEFNFSELSQIAYYLTFLNKIKFNGLILNFANRILLLNPWNFNFTELAKILYFSATQGNNILFEKCAKHIVFEVDVFANDFIFSSYLISKSLTFIDSKCLFNFYNIIDFTTKISIGILKKYIQKTEEFLLKIEKNSANNIIYDLDLHDLETLQLDHLMSYFTCIIKLGFNNYEFVTLLNDYISKLLLINLNPKRAETSAKKIIHNPKYSVDAFISYYLKSKSEPTSIPDFNVLLKIILYTNPSEIIAKRYIKMLEKNVSEINLNDVLYANRQLLYDDPMVNDLIINLLDDNTAKLEEFNDYGFYKFIKTESNSIVTTSEQLDAFIVEMNSHLKEDGDYRFVIRNKETVLRYCLYVVSSGFTNHLPSILSVASEIVWAFSLSQNRQLLYTLFDNMVKFTVSDILTRNCLFRLFNLLLKSQVPLFNIHHVTYQLSLIYKLIQYNEVINESTKDLDMQIDNKFVINVNGSAVVGPLVASSWFSKLSGLEMLYTDLDYGLEAYKKIESHGHPLKNYSTDTLYDKSKDLLNGKYEDNEFSKFISDKPRILRLIIEGTLRYV